MGTQARIACRFELVPPGQLILQMCMVDAWVDGRRTDTYHRPTPTQLPGLPEFDTDSSWPLYTMYSKIAKDEDNKLVERCQRDTDGTLIFVSSQITLVLRWLHVN